MWHKNNLSFEILSLDPPSKPPVLLNYQNIIQNQQEVIRQLQNQIHYLRQYFFFVSDLPESFTNPKHDLSTSADLTTNLSQQKASKKIMSLKSLILEIMDTLNAGTPEQIIPKLAKLDEKANRKIEPVFIERVKQKEVPIIIQKIKEVEKPIVIERIVQSDRKEGEKRKDLHEKMGEKEYRRKKNRNGQGERQEKRYWKKEKEERQKKYVEKKQ